MVLYLIKINIHYYLKFRIPILHRKFFRKLSQNEDYVQTHCTGLKNPFHFACRKGYLYNNPQCRCSIFTLFLILVQTSIITPIQIYLIFYLYK